MSHQMSHQLSQSNPLPAIEAAVTAGIELTGEQLNWLLQAGFKACDPRKRKDACYVLSEGRLGFTATAHCMRRTLDAYNMDELTSWGGAWEDGVHNAVRTELNSGNHKYIVFVDGDSGWQPHDLDLLFEIVDNDQTVDAVCPVQARRVGSMPLAYNHCLEWLPDLRLPDYSDKYSQIAHGHHGLTIIRTEVFLQMTPPWFERKYGPDGATIQMPDTGFWRKFAELGKKVVQANWVVAGHAELMMLWQNGAQVYCQPIQHYLLFGPPKGLHCPTAEEVMRVWGPALTHVSSNQMNEQNTQHVDVVSEGVECEGWK